MVVSIIFKNRKQSRTSVYSENNHFPLYFSLILVGALGGGFTVRIHLENPNL